MIKIQLDTLMVCERKLESFFPRAQFCICGLTKSHIMNRNAIGKVALLYVREGMASKLI